jgi:hypothetical protein
VLNYFIRHEFLDAGLPHNKFLKSCAAAKAVGCVCSEDQSDRASGGVGKNGVVRVASGFGRSAAGSGRLSRYFRRRKLAVI